MAYAPPPPPPMKRPYQGDWAPPRPAKEPRPPGMGDMYSGPAWGAGYPEYDYYGWGNPDYSSNPGPNYPDYSENPGREYPDYTENPGPDDYYDNSTPSNNITVDFTDDYSAFYGNNVQNPCGNGNQQGGYNAGPGSGQFQNVMNKPQGMQKRGQFYQKRGRGQWNQNRDQFNQNRGRGNFNRGSGNHNRGQFNQTRGQGNLNRGQGNQNRGQGNLNRGQGNQDRGRGNQQNRGGNRGGQFRGRGRGGQRGMSQNVFNSPRGRGRGSNKASAAVLAIVPPVAKEKPELPDIQNMSMPEKLSRFCAHLKNDGSVKVNAVQTIMNAISSSKLGIKAIYDTVELAKVAGKPMFTGVLVLNSVFLARAVRHNKKDLKQEVFQKALDNMLSMTVEDIYKLIDPGAEAVRKELKNHMNADKVKLEEDDTDIITAEARYLVGGDIRTILTSLINAIKKMKKVPESPICVIEQAATAANLLVKQEYQVEVTRMKNGHLFYKGKLSVGAIVIGCGGGITKKRCKIDTYKKTLDRLKTLPVSELLESVPEDPVPDTDLAFNTCLSLEDRFTNLLDCLRTLPSKGSSIMQIDGTAMKAGLIPMVLFKLSEMKSEKSRNIICEVYLEKVFIASNEGKLRRDCMTKAYNAAFEVLTTTSVDTLLNEHKRITDEEVKDQTLLDIFVKGSGRTVESNLTGLRRQGNDIKEIEERKLEDLIIVENSDWSKDRLRNAFCILQYSCNQNGMILQWELDAVQNSFRCVISVQKQQLGESTVSKKTNAKNNAAVEALFKLYQTQDIIKVASRTEDEKKWIPWESIAAEAAKLRTETVEEEPVVKNDESGDPSPDTFLMKVLESKVDEFVKNKEEDELIIGPGIDVTEGQALRKYSFNLKLKCDTMYFHGKPYLLIYEKLDLKELVSVLKGRDRPYGKFVLVDKEELPEETEMKNFIAKSTPNVDTSEHS